jgi:HKD family nuclease
MFAAATIELLPHDSALGDRLAQDLRDAQALSIAVAFAKESALAAVDLESWATPDRRLRLLAGTDFALTELGLLRRLEPRPGVSCRVFHSLTGASFHPKLYVIEKESTRIAYVGSSNLTMGGLRTNVEANVRVEAPLASREAEEPLALFERLFQSEFATPITPEFEARYNELQEQQRVVIARHLDPRARDRLRVAESLLVGRHRAQTAPSRQLLVVSPENFALCMRHGTWGHQHEQEIRAYQPGDIFFFHVTKGRGIAAMGMFTGPAYFDRAEVWQDMGNGSFPWRRKFVVLGELRTGIPTRQVLEPLRPGAPKNWFHGFIQSSHSLTSGDFAALQSAFEAALREESGLGGLEKL